MKGCHPDQTVFMFMAVTEHAASAACQSVPRSAAQVAQTVFDDRIEIPAQHRFGAGQGIAQCRGTSSKLRACIFPCCFLSPSDGGGIAHTQHFGCGLETSRLQDQRCVQHDKRLAFAVNEHDKWIMSDALTSSHRCKRRGEIGDSPDKAPA